MATYNITASGGVKAGGYDTLIVGGYGRDKNTADIYHVQANPTMGFVVEDTFGCAVLNGGLIQTLRPNGGWTTSGQAKWSNQDDSYTMVDQLGLWQWVDDPVDFPDYDTYIVLATSGDEIGDSGTYGNGFLCQMSPFSVFPQKLTLRIHYTMTGLGTDWLHNISLGYDPEDSGNPSVFAEGVLFDQNIGSNTVHTQDFDMKFVNEEYWVDKNHVIGKPLLFSFNTHRYGGDYNNNPATGFMIFAIEIVCEYESSYAIGEVTNLKESEGFAVSCWYKTWRPTSGSQVIMNRQNGQEAGWELSHNYFYTDSRWDTVLSLMFWNSQYNQLIGTGGNYGELRLTPNNDWTHVVAQYRPSTYTGTLRPQSDIDIPAYVSKFGDSGTYTSAVNGSVDDTSTDSGIYLVGNYVTVNQAHVFNMGSMEELPSQAKIRIYAKGNAVGAVATGWTLSDANDVVFAEWTSSLEDQDNWLILDEGIYEYPLTITPDDYDLSTVKLGWGFTDYATDPNTEDQIAFWIYDIEIVTEDFGSVEIMVDGILRQSYSPLLPPQDSSSRLILGASDGLASNPLKGYLKDVRLYDRALTEGEAYQIFRHGDELYTSPLFLPQKATTQYYDETAEGGLVAGGDADVVSILSIDTSGGVVCGGEAGIDDIGLVCGGSADVSVVSSIVTSGGVVCGGSALPVRIFIDVASGGVLAGGAALSWTNNFTTFTYKRTITVPAGAVSEDLYKFYLGVVVDVDPESIYYDGVDIRITDSQGNKLYHDLRSYYLGTMQIFFKADLLADEDNVFFIEYGGIQ